ncbi:MAG: DUF6942 family protein [Shewanella sp.]
MSPNPQGLGDPKALLKVYIENRPQFMGLEQLNCVQPLVTGEIAAIAGACGNGWRKVFSVYAKLMFAIKYDVSRERHNYHCWQDYRDQALLQACSDTALLFSAPLDVTSLPLGASLTEPELSTNPVHIIMGRTYAKQLIARGLITAELDWLDNEFAIDRAQRLLVCPYFDYRQLTNVKLARLAELIDSLLA